MRFLSLFAFLCCLSCGLDAQTLTLAQHHYGVDENEALIVCRADLPALNASYDDKWTFVEIGEERRYRFRTPTDELRYGQRYRVFDDSDKRYQLYFTQLPIIHLNPYAWIPPDEKLPVDFTYADDEQTLVAVAGAETRGGFTSGLPKKTYDLEFWVDTSGVDNVDVSFGGLRSDDDWILDAVYNEPLRVNAFVAHQLWEAMYTLPYVTEDDRARPGVGVRWCEVFRDGRYDGLYFLSEQIDRKQLRLKKYREETGILRGELYKSVGNGGAADYIWLPAPPQDSLLLWRGIEPKYPDEDGVRWGTLYDYFDFVLNGSNAQFDTIFNSWLDLENVVDFFLFINVIAAEDNARKNIYYARYDADEPFLFIPWDLDGTLGNKWNGERAGYRVDSLISNRMFDRLIERNVGGFNDALCARYTELKDSGLLQHDSIQARIQTQLDYLERNGVFAREEKRWPGSLSIHDDERSYTSWWNERRLAYFDRWFCDMTVSTPAIPDIQPAVRLYPNPTNSVVAVRLPTPKDEDYTVSDLTGRIVLRGHFSGGSGQLNLSNQRAGMYLLRIGNTVHKIIRY